MDSTSRESEELFVERESDECPPPYSSSSKATTYDHRRNSHSRDDGKEDEEQSDEHSIDGEFEEVVREEMNKFGNPYNPQQEPPPKLAAYHPSFTKVEALCAEVFRDATMILEASEYTDKYTEQLLDMIQHKQNIKYDPPCRIGIIGDSGGATGSAMTCIITEFHHAPLSQETPFLATVELFARTQIQEMLREHLQAYYQFRLESLKDVDEEESNERELQARTALDVLVALFAGRESFRNEDCAREFLGKATSKEDPYILQCFSTWIDDLMNEHRPQNGLVYVTASTAEELSNHLEPWLTSSSMVEEDGCSQTPSFWPIVRIARVGMQSALLERGLVICDLPGLSDINKVRTKATERYIRKCEYYFLVAPIARVQSDDAVHKRLRQAYKLKGSRRALITTKVDDISSNEKPRNLGATLEEADSYNRLSQALAYVGAERVRLAKLTKTQKGKKRLETDSKMAELMSTKKIYHALMRRSLVEMRNKKVNAAVRKHYQTMTDDFGWLPVFNVSNRDYEMHKCGYDEEEIPLPLHMTGIKQMRYLISTFPAEGRRSVLHHHWKGNLTSLVESLDTWSSQSAIHRQADIRKAVEKPREETEAHIAELIEALKEEFKNIIMTSMKKDLKAWEQHSVRLSEQWTRMNGQSFGAFVRKNGLHKPKGGLHRNWNSELLEPVAKDINKSWVPLEKIFGDCRDDCLARLVKLIEDIRDDLNAIKGVSVLPMVPFLRSLPSKKEHLRRCLVVFFGKILNVCNDARLDAIMEEDESLLMQAMLPIYAKMRAVKGNHLAIQRKTLLNDSMARGEPFAKILPGVQKAIDEGLKRLQPELVKSVQEVFQMVLVDFDLMFVVEELPDPRRDALRDQIKGFVCHARAKIDSQIATEYALATKGD